MPKPIMSSEYGSRGIGARDAELGLHRGQRHGHDVHAARAERHQQHRHDEAHGRVA